jgi:transposase-like protein
LSQFALILSRNSLKFPKEYRDISRGFEEIYANKQANSLKKSSSSNLHFKNASKYPDILSDFLKLILNKSDFL